MNTQIRARVRALARAACWATLFVAPLRLPAAAAEAVVFSAHRAVYEITLKRAAPGSGVAGLNGRMVFELNGSVCDGYTQNMRFVTRMTNQEGAETVNDLRSSSFEDLPGKRLKFSSQQHQNETVVEASQGEASHDKSSNASSVDLVKPAKKKVGLPQGIYFPIQHAAALITAARDGRQLFQADLYDGSEKGDKYYATTSIIGKKAERGAVRAPAAFAGADKLATFASWPVAISYFDPTKANEDSPPSYELSFRYYENGVTADLAIDYGEFAIEGKLTELTLLDAGSCAEGAH